MTLRECYDAVGGNYDEAVRRLISEDNVRNFLRLFLEDRSYHDLEEAAKEGDLDAIFRSVHVLKGVCLNLGLDNLAHAASSLTEAVRGGKQPSEDELMEMLHQIAEDYDTAVEAIRSLD